MSKNTVKPRLTRKRAKRVVENTQYDAFARRVLRAYAQRVGRGDIEALGLMVGLRSDIDAVIRAAVQGLREFGYSWAEIADRLGVTRQAVQMRYGTTATERGALDRRLLDAGMTVTVATLVEVFADHHPGSPRTTVCPRCGYTYPNGATDCPTLATVRPMLYRRRSEDKHALARLTGEQLADLHNRNAARHNRKAIRAAQPLPPPPDRAPSLLDHTSGGDAR